MTSRDKIVYVIGLIVAIAGIWYIFTFEPFNATMLDKDISQYELKWYEVLLGFISLGFFVILIIKLILFPLFKRWTLQIKIWFMMREWKYNEKVSK